MFRYFFPLSFKNCNKLDEYIYTYFLLSQLYFQSTFFIIKIVVGVIEIDR